MSLLQDVRFALRLLVKSPVFTIVAVLTLALGIGANTVMFSVLHAIVLRPLPYAEPDRLVQFHTRFPSMALEDFWVSPPEYDDLARDARSFERVGAWATGRANFVTGEQKAAITAAYSTATLIPTLGVEPALGRWISEAEDVPGDAQVVVIGHGLWTRVFGADPGVLGRTVHLDAVPVRIIGVMPKGFDFPGNGTELWVPLGIDHTKGNRGSHMLYVIGRLARDASVTSARAEMASLMAAWGAGFVVGGANRMHAIQSDLHPMILRPLQEEITGSVRAALAMLQIAVLLVLLIACANVSNLLLARAEARSGEIAIRTAVGAGRGRMARQFLTESLLLGLLGAGAGILLAVWGLDAVVHLMPEGAPRAAEIGIDGTVLAFAVGSAIACSVVFGVAPIFHTGGNQLGTLLRGAANRSTSGASKQRFRRALVVIEVALAVVLVLGAGVTLRSFARLQQVDLGFRPEGLLTLELQLPEKAYPKDADVNAFWTRLRDRAAAIPGVASATVLSGLPPVRRIDASDLEIIGQTRTNTRIASWITDFWQIASDEVFATLGTRLVEGRLFDRTDTERTAPVVVINQTMARKYFPGESAIGKRLRVAPWRRDSAEQTIVGVVADVKQQGIDAPAGTEVFVPLAQSLGIVGEAQRTMCLALRAQGDPRSLFGALRAEVGALDPTLPIARMETMDRLVYEAVAKPRFITTLLTVFAGIALLMAAVGIYGVMSYAVEQRTQELGVRIALGAAPAAVQQMLLRQGVTLAAVGVAVGVVASAAMNLALARALAALLFEAQRFDPVIHIGVAALTLGVAALACWAPARRATRIHPMTAMRHE